MLIYIFKQWRNSRKIRKLNKEKDELLSMLFGSKDLSYGDEDRIRKRWIGIENEMRCLKDDNYAKEQKRITKLNKEKLIAKRKKK